MSVPGNTAPLLTSPELLGVLNVSRSTLWRLRRDGLPALRVRGSLRFDLEAVRAWLATDPTASLSPGDYRCRTCGFVGAVQKPHPLRALYCPQCRARANVERVGSA